MATAKRYGIFSKADPTQEIFGHGCESHADMTDLIEANPRWFIAMVQVTDEDIAHGYVACPA